MRLPITCRRSTLLLLAAASPLGGQAPPATDILLLELDSAGTAVIGTPRAITQRDGYDNQPSFTPDGAILYTSIRDGQADAYRYDPAAGTTTRATNTAESEYSPTTMPDGRDFSVVRVEDDGTQRLWAFDPAGAPRLLLPAVRPVGYHAWVDEHTVALFVLGEPATLRVADTTTGATYTVTGDIGRSLQKVPGRRAITFVHHFDDDTWWIRELDLGTRHIRTVAPLPAADGYHAWCPDGTLLTARGQVVYRWDGQDWVVLADLGAGAQVSRLAVSGDGRWLAVVVGR